MTHHFTLEDVFRRQKELQVRILGFDPIAFNDDERADYIRTMSLALMDEIHEAMNETGWKPWAKSRHFNTEAFGRELVDAFHFLVNLVLLTEWTASEFLEMYFAKAAVNQLRQENGYTGLEKCEHCGRAIDEPVKKNA